MSTQLPAVPVADLDKLCTIAPRDLALGALAFQNSASVRGLARRLAPWGVSPAQARAALDALAQERMAQESGDRWTLRAAGAQALAERFDLDAESGWPAFAARNFPALALGLDPRAAETRSYLAKASGLYAATLAALFGLAAPSARPALGQVRAALIWRIVAARCPDLIAGEAPEAMLGPSDALARTLYVRFSGLTHGSVDQATPALLRRVLPAPVGQGVGGLRRALVRAALNSSAGGEAIMPESETPAPTLAEDTCEPEAFAEAVAALARGLRTPKARGGYFTGGQVAIAQLHDAYAADRETPMSLNDFKRRLWEAVRDGAGFHLTRLDIPDLMAEELRKRSATPTRAGDVVHFVVVD